MQCHWTVQLKILNFMLCVLYPHKKRYVSVCRAYIIFPNLYLPLKRGNPSWPSTATPWPCLLLCSCIYLLWHCDSSFIFYHSLFLGLKPDLDSKAQLLTHIPGIRLFFPPLSVISQLFWGTLYCCFPKLFLPPGPHFCLCSCLEYQILNHSGTHCCFSSLTP